MKCLVIRHLAFEDLGVFAPVLTERGYEIAYRQAGVHPLSQEEWLAADLGVVLGGPIGVYEQDRYPWLTQEMRRVGQRLRAGKPTLGICLGAQIIAAALGARVYPGKAKEIGWAPVSLTPEGQASPLRHLAGVPVLHWHGDTFDLPAGARLLAGTAITQHQAFAITDQALALQFHPEVDASAIECWLIGHTAELSQAGVDVVALREASQRHGAAAALAGAALLRDWLARG
ncbi:glutamine amidotransferase [Roseateles toxinivorans]|uniref:GMP synthase (Glutamine-hydrolysing) n=1 Tax=Roseateles toxinivorans TaxID=270368 RepID=A0A4R6QLT5_9BURK|nr:glutamine amidotransferase [Roseateles toxinivorans]TDP63775.1 GMP synthase (glutamine-hydrolysing) [Roseateles toxinivorans]